MSEQSLTTRMQHFDIAQIIDQTRLTQEARSLEVSQHSEQLRKYHEEQIATQKPQLDELDAQAGLIEANIVKLQELLATVNVNRVDLKAAILAHMAGVASLDSTSLDKNKKG